MTDPLIAKQHDDVSSAYLNRTELREDEDLAFLFGPDEAEAAPVPKSLGKSAVKQTPPNAIKEALGATTNEEAESWSWENAAEKTGDIISDVGEGVFQESPRAVVWGLREGAQEFIQTTKSFGDWLNDNFADLGHIKLIDENGELTFDYEEGNAKEGVILPSIDEPDSTTGQAIGKISQFLAGFIPAFRAMKGIKAASTGAHVAKSATAGAVSDFAFFDPYEDDLIDKLDGALEGFPEIQTAAKEYIFTDEDDNEAFARLKKAGKGVLFGTALDGVIHGVRWLRSVHKNKRAVKSQANVGPDVSSSQNTAELQKQARTVGVEETAEDVLPSLGDSTQPKVKIISVSDKEAELFRMPIQGDKVAVPNLARIDVPEDVQEVITKAAELFRGNIEEARRGKVLNEVTADLASDLDMTVDDLLSRRKGQAFNAEEALAARQILASSADQLTMLAKKAATADASATDVVAFRRALSVHGSIQAQVSGMTAEAGRALQSFKIIAKGSSDRDRQIRELLEGNGGDLFNRDMAQKLADIAQENPAALNKSAREMTQASGWDQMYEVWVNGLLSGPQTHAVNILSNSIVAAWQVPERWLAHHIGSLIGDAGVQSGEASAQAFGLVHGFKDGVKLAAKALRTGEGSDLIGKLEQSHRSFSADNFAGTRAGRAVNMITAGSLDSGGIAARGVDLLGEVARVPSRFLTAEDELFKAVGYRMELRAQAFRTAKAEGLEGKEMAERIAQIVADPPEHIHMSSVDAARYQTFTKPLGEAGQAAQKWVRTVPGLRLVAPFIRTPTNILKYVGERTPLAPLSREVRADISAGGARRDLALAKIGMGTMIMATSADMASGGFITGGGPSEGQMKAHLRNTGWQPYSIKIGEKYYSYNRLDPLGMTIGLAADTAEIMGQLYGEEDGDGGVDELGMAAVMAIAKNTTSKTWLMGVSELIEAIEDPDRNMTRFLQRFSGSLIPTGVAQTNRAFNDNTLRDTKGLDIWQSLLNQMQSRIPGYSEDLPPRTNVWGDPIVMSGGLGPDIISPFYTSTGKYAPVDEELMRLQVPIRMPMRQLDGVKLTATEYHRYVELSGNKLKDPSTGLGLKETLTGLVNGTHPQAAIYNAQTDGPDGGKALMMQKYVSAFRKMAKQQLLEEIPELADLIRESKEERAKALSGS